VSSEILFLTNEIEWLKWALELLVPVVATFALTFFGVNYFLFTKRFDFLKAELEKGVTGNLENLKKNLELKIEAHSQENLSMTSKSVSTLAQLLDPNRSKVEIQEGLLEWSFLRQLHSASVTGFPEARFQSLEMTRDLCAKLGPILASRKDEFDKIVLGMIIEVLKKENNAKTQDICKEILQMSLNRKTV
jgi:hypothetical protein